MLTKTEMQSVLVDAALRIAQNKQPNISQPLKRAMCVFEEAVVSPGSHCLPEWNDWHCLKV